jgi:hypothetical protein
MITYKDRRTQVELGDRVETRIFFRKHRGRVAYVPGVSRLNATMERDGLRWIGVRLDEGGFMSVGVDPDQNFAIGNLTFLSRDPLDVPEIGADQDPHGDDSFLAF